MEWQNYSSLVNISLEAFNWDATTKNLSIQYLHHNGHTFLLASKEDDNDVKRMLIASGNNINGIYSYVFKSPNNVDGGEGEQP